MAVKVVLPLSTCDIHLLRTGGGNTFQMVVIADNTANNISNHADTTLVGFDASVAAATTVGGASPHILFSANATGETIGKVRHRDSNGTFEFLVRVRVHQSLSDFWIGNNQVTVHKDMSNYVLSIYATFSDGTRGDISGHPYVTFTSNNNPVATVDSLGRLTGVSPGTARIDVKVGTTTKSIEIHVVDPVNSARPIVRRIHGSGLFSERRNILFLGDGFSNVVDFDKIASEIMARLMFTVSHIPYNVMRDSFNIWTACEPQNHPSPEAGITFTAEVRVPSAATPSKVPFGNPVPPGFENEIKGPPGRMSVLHLVSLVGLPTSWLPSPPTTVAQARTVFGALRNFDGVTPTFNAALSTALDQPTLDAWLELRDHGPLQARNSKLGMCHGGRLGEREGVIATLPNKNAWYLPDNPHRGVTIDQRRRDNARSFFTFIDEYLKSLKLAGVPATDPNFNIGSTWAAAGGDVGLGCLILNDDYLGGTRVGSIGAGGKFEFFASCVNVHTKLAVPAPTPATSTVLNHTAPNPASVPFETITVVLAHELAHSLELNDEYEGSDQPHHTTVANATPFELQDMRASSNVTPFQDVEGLVTPGKVDPSRAKWNRHRIKLASALAAPVTGTGTNTITVQLKTAEGNRWRTVMTQSEEVFLRHPDLKTDPTNANTSPLRLKIDPSSNLAADTLTLKMDSGTFTGTFPKGSTLYLPKRDGSNNIMGVIHQSVITHIRANGSFAAQAPGTCHQFNGGPENPPANIANFTLPAIASAVVGLYEGGGTFTCRVYRPCGACRMRIFDPASRTQLRFCFVCQYMLVNLIDPSQHHIIDSLYP